MNKSISFLDLQKVTQRYRDEIHEAVQRVTDSGWYLRGAENARFESAYADYIGTRYCVGCGNGLDALTLIYRAYIELGRMKPGDEVIVPANTFIASILAITENGLVPVLVEPNLHTLEIDEEEIERHITEKTRSVMLVHLYGRCTFTPRIAQICSQHQLLLVEDNAQAHGCCTADGRHTGSLGAAAGHSFYPGKNLGALGDGGAVTTDDEELAEVVRALSNYGSHKKYVFQYKGRNSRLDEIQAAVLSVKLKYLDADNRHRRDIARIYREGIDNRRVWMPDVMPDERMNVYHLFPVFCEQRDDLQAYLSQHGIQTLIHYPIAPHQQECYQEMGYLSLPVTEQIHRQELSLPMSQVMEEEEAKEVVRRINEFK